MSISHKSLTLEQVVSTRRRMVVTMCDAMLRELELQLKEQAATWDPISERARGIALLVRIPHT